MSQTVRLGEYTMCIRVPAEWEQPLKRAAVEGRCTLKQLINGLIREHVIEPARAEPVPRRRRSAAAAN